MKPENKKVDSHGRFKPVYKLWSLKQFNEGYITKAGRFVVRRPDHSRANANGWIVRSIVAYEAYHPGENITTEFIIHHKDENKLNDSKDNLVKISFGEHTRLHWKGKSRKGQNAHLKTGKEQKCPTCGKTIYRMGSELKKENYCCKKCFYNRNKVACVCDTCGKSFKKFKHRIKEFNFCSYACMRPKWSREHPINRRKNV